MSASPILHPALQPVPDDLGAEEARRRELRDAAAVARERLAALPGVRVLGDDDRDFDPSVGIRLALDLRDTGRDAWDVACALAMRGLGVESAGGRALVVRLRESDVAEGLHERLAPALLQALWIVPVRPGFELALDEPPEDPPTGRRFRRF